jgi:hypothetical protein
MIRAGNRDNRDDTYFTDAWILAMVGPHYDPCPANANFDPLIHEDGLDVDWVDRSLPHNGKVFVNPPYSKPKPWVEKAIRAAAEGCTVVMLLKHDTSTKWYALLHEAGAHMLYPAKRLKHCTKNGSSFPSLIAVLQPQPRH